MSYRLESPNFARIGPVAITKTFGQCAVTVALFFVAVFRISYKRNLVFIMAKSWQAQEDLPGSDLPISLA